MRITVASGKGGTGKTTVSVCLALSLVERTPVQLIDCDVEEPNAHFFLNCPTTNTVPVSVSIPEVDRESCTACRTCVEVCQFNALALIKDEVLVFPQLCHSCSGCWHFCPEQAISEGFREIGSIKTCRNERVQLVYGTLDIGEPMSPPLIRKVQEKIDEAKTVVIDSPPGTTCPMMVTVQKADYCVLVTENTPFGLHDLEISVQAIRSLNMPMGVIINRSDIGRSDVKRYCRENELPVLLEIPFDRRIAEAYSNGTPFVDTLPEYREKFAELCEVIERRIGTGTV
jgi:MinD superfamily P-loop ATPase